MATIKLTAKGIVGLPAGLYYDEELKGFGLRVGATSATWFVEYRPGAGGRAVAKKRVKVARTDKLTADRAREAAGRILAGVTLGGDPAKAKAEERASMTFRELAARYVEDHVRAKKKSRTADYYRGTFDLHVDPRIGALRAALVTRADIQRMHRATANKHGTQGGRYIANRAVAIVSAVYGWAAGEGFVPEGLNPAKSVKRFKEEGRERFLTSDEMQRLGDALREAETVGLPYDVDEDKPRAKHARKPENRRTLFSPHITGAIRLLMLTGCRLREILHLEWSQVDLERGLLFLPDSKTGRKTVTLSTAAMDILAALPRIGRYVVAGRGAATNNEQPRRDLKKPWTAVCKRAGLDGVRLHDLRHTFASVGAGSGLGLPVVGNLLGHSNAKTTQRYAHVANDAARRAADVIADKIATQIGGK